MVSKLRTPSCKFINLDYGKNRFSVQFAVNNKMYYCLSSSSSNTVALILDFILYLIGFRCYLSLLYCNSSSLKFSILLFFLFSFISSCVADQVSATNGSQGASQTKRTSGGIHSYDEFRDPAKMRLHDMLMVLSWGRDYATSKDVQK